MRKHLIIATYDGIGTYYCGVGTIAKNIVNALHEFSSEENLKVSIAYINVDKNSVIFNKDCFDNASKLVRNTGGTLIPLCNNTSGQTEWDMWRSFKEWDYTSVSLVTVLNMVLRDDEDNYIILNDTPFLFLAKYKHLINEKNLKCFYFPLSTGKNHAFGNIEWRNNRIRIEQYCFDLIDQDGNSKVISLGKTFAKRLTDDYGLSFGENDYLQNGLCFVKYTEYLDKQFNNDELKRHGIKLEDHQKIIFAWGRCSIAKGFKELALAWVKAHEKLADHVLVLQMPNNSGENDYFNEVTEILKSVPRCVILDNFDPNIWMNVLRASNTDVVCIPSLMDPFPHTSIEAKLFSKNMNYVTIISDVDGAVDAFDESEAIYVDPRDVTAFSKSVICAANMDTEERRRMIDKNEETIGNFNFPVIFKEFIRKNLQ
jgi:hypothetical protein